MNIVLVKEYKDGVEIVEMYSFRKRFIRYWLCILVNKIRGRKVEVIKE